MRSSRMSIPTGSRSAVEPKCHFRSSSVGQRGTKDHCPPRPARVRGSVAKYVKDCYDGGNGIRDRLSFCDEIDFTQNAPGQCKKDEFRMISTSSLQTKNMLEKKKAIEKGQTNTSYATSPFRRCEKVRQVSSMRKFSNENIMQATQNNFQFTNNRLFPHRGAGNEISKHGELAEVTCARGRGGANSRSRSLSRNRSQSQSTSVTREYRSPSMSRKRKINYATFGYEVENVNLAAVKCGGEGQRPKADTMRVKAQLRM